MLRTSVPFMFDHSGCKGYQLRQRDAEVGTLNSPFLHPHLTALAGLFLPEVIPGVLFGVTNAENLQLECFSAV